jgi:hypothetical protein
MRDCSGEHGGAGRGATTPFGKLILIFLLVEERVSQKSILNRNLAAVFVAAQFA